MTVALVTETYWPEVNGVAMTLSRLVNGLAERGHFVQLICPVVNERDPKSLPSNVSYHPVRGLPIPGYKEANIGFPSKTLLNHIWARERPDVIYVATEGPLGWNAVKIAGALGIPVVSGFHTNFHSYSKHYKLGFMENIVKKYLVSLHNKTQTTIVPTNEQRDILIEMGVDHVEVMGRGVDAKLFSPEKRSTILRNQWGVTNNDLVMLYVGRIAEEKNIELTIKTYFQLKKLKPNLKFVLVGDGPLREKIHKKYPEFIFTGIQTGENLAKYYASGDIFIFSSLTETFGNVILEAMASGLAVVSFDYAAGGLHIHSGSNGLLVNINDVNEFVKKSKSLVMNEVLLKKIRLNACSYSKQHSWSVVIELFEKILYSHCDEITFNLRKVM